MCGFMTSESIGYRGMLGGGCGVARGFRGGCTSPDNPSQPPRSGRRPGERLRNKLLLSTSRLSAEVWGQVREGPADPQVRTERRWNTTSVSRETREAVVALAPEACRATVPRCSGTGRCGYQAAIEECVWQRAESRRLPRCVAWAMTRMRLYAYVLFRVVARSARN